MIVISVEDIVVIIYIFGIIGRFKGVELIYFNLMFNGILSVDLMGGWLEDV